MREHGSHHTGPNFAALIFFVFIFVFGLHVSNAALILRAKCDSLQGEATDLTARTRVLEGKEEQLQQSESTLRTTAAELELAKQSLEAVRNENEQLVAQVG